MLKRSVKIFLTIFGFFDIDLPKVCFGVFFESQFFLFFKRSQATDPLFTGVNHWRREYGDDGRRAVQVVVVFQDGLLLLYAHA
jgi:hypothetical protein